MELNIESPGDSAREILEDLEEYVWELEDPTVKLTFTLILDVLVKLERRTRNGA